MRYFLDTEYNGFGGDLISLALVPEHGDQEFYATLPLPGQLHPWVERHVIPYLHSVDVGAEHCDSREAACRKLLEYLAQDPDPLLVADWTEDIGHVCSLLTPAAGQMAPIPTIRFQMVALPGFSAAANSRIPHNALHDARALREFLLEMEGLRSGAGGGQSL